MIEWRWSLRPLTVRDATANNLAEALDFTHVNLTAPAFNVPPGPYGGLCVPNAEATVRDAALLEFAAQLGFPVPEQ
jgi:phospholipase C